MFQSAPSFFDQILERMSFETVILPKFENVSDYGFDVSRFPEIRGLKDRDGNSMFEDGNALSLHDAFQQLG
jgi:hypothetical protein